MAKRNRRPVSVVATVLNEAENVAALLDSIASQTRAPDEVVVVDGGSHDGTLATLNRRAGRRDLPLLVLSRPGSNISAGRNAAIGAARGPVIACTDAGVRLSPQWLASLTAPFEQGARFVAGSFVADPRGSFETALAATTLPLPREIRATRFLPSSRSVAFEKDDWRRIGGYPEWLDFSEDLVFDLRLIASVGRPGFEPGASVRYRPRGNLSAFVRQYYRYARGDGKADLWIVRHAIRYATYLAVGPGLVWLSLWRHWAWSLALAAGLALMLHRPYSRLPDLWRGLSARERAAAAAWAPVIRIAGDVAKMVGYPVGLAWRWRKRPPEWRPSPRTGRL